MNGRELIWNSEITGITYRESDNDNCIIVVSSPSKINGRMDYIRTEFPNAGIINIDEEFGYGLYEVKLQ